MFRAALHSLRDFNLGFTRSHDECHYELIKILIMEL
ncbi:hypothetical protein EDF56_11447 [Novosphingobium sp. PhB165]|nr:hypothetical protein EDF56_11447 [Novosphingobium sp. PhB165]